MDPAAAINIEESQAHRFQVEATREHRSVVFADQFCRAYGDFGIGVIVSTFGSTSVSPYAEDDAAYTTRPQPPSAAARRTLNVPSMFTSCEGTGSSIDRGTDGIAARWNTVSAPAMIGAIAA